MSTALKTSRAVAAAERTLDNAARSVAALAKAVHTIDRLRATLGPGSLLHDLVVLANPRAGDDRRMAAERRLARQHLGPSDVFFINRWILLEDAFRAWRGERSFLDGWEELVGPCILIEYEAIPRDIPLGEVRSQLRRLLRPAVERDLLGHTLDSRARFSPLEDPGVYEVEDRIGAADQRLEASAALRGLDPHEQWLLREYYQADSAGRKAMAQRLGVSRALLRKQVERAKEKVRELST